jgi:SAM-dependent methyltransferase
VVCGGASIRARFELSGLAWRIVVCEACGTGREDPLPFPDEIAAFYPPAYYGTTGNKFKRYVEWAVRFVAARHVRFLARRVPPGGRVLDVGCGRGTLLAALADRGLEVHGMEVSRAAVEGADPRAQIRIASDLTEAAYPGDHFDLVILWHVFEHLRDPRRTLDEVHRILRPGGEVVIAVPNFSSWQARWAGAAWFHLDPPRHLYHFPIEALRTLLRSAGVESRSEHHFSLRQNPFGWVQSWLNRRPRWRRNALYELLQRRGAKARQNFDLSTQFELLAAFAVGMPLGLLLEVFATVARRGATVHVVARAKKSG